MEAGIINRKNNKDIYILGIETSCDDTCASVVKNGTGILSNVISSQDEIHRKYGGIVPEIASRKHIEIIDMVIKEALEKASTSIERIDAVSVTNRPGLIGSLLVGVGAAKALCYLRKIPIIDINHLEAHLYANMINNPGTIGGSVGLIVSGGHSSLYHIDSSWHIKKIGHTVDDAAGEAFDKIARYLGLGYPGGPIIDRLSKKGRDDRFDFPRPMIGSGDFNFSFSGLKTSLIYLTKKDKSVMAEENMADLAASFQKAIVDVLARKSFDAAARFECGTLFISGGVAANSLLREEFTAAGREKNIKVYIPPLGLCLDNAAMVAALGYYKYLKGEFGALDMDVYSRSDF